MRQSLCAVLLMSGLLGGQTASAEVITDLGLLLGTPTALSVDMSQDESGQIGFRTHPGGVRYTFDPLTASLALTTTPVQTPFQEPGAAFFDSLAATGLVQWYGFGRANSQGQVITMAASLIAGDHSRDGVYYFDGQHLSLIFSGNVTSRPDIGENGYAAFESYGGIYAWNGSHVFSVDLGAYNTRGGWGVLINGRGELAVGSGNQYGDTLLYVTDWENGEGEGPPAAVPEPSTLLLMGAACAGLLAAKYRFST